MSASEISQVENSARRETEAVDMARRMGCSLCKACRDMQGGGRLVSGTPSPHACDFIMCFVILSGYDHLRAYCLNINPGINDVSISGHTSVLAAASPFVHLATHSGLWLAQPALGIHHTVPYPLLEILLQYLCLPSV